MPEEVGKCPGCDHTGPVGKPCDEKACAKRGYHFIPEAFWTTAHESGAPDPLIGEVLGDYLVVGVVGSGGFGRVFLALQSPLFRLRGALKLLEFPSDNAVLTQALLEKFQGEAEALADLSHPNIVRLLKYGLHKQRPYLVMEYVDDAATLRQEIYDRAMQRKGFSHAQVQSILGQILHGLQAAHARNIIHRDIKPENVMLQRVAGNPMHVRILDFGTAKFVENRADTKWPLGSPSYMAPEQVRLKNIGPWSDLYAVGVMCFELLTGRRPFPGATENEIVANKLDENFDPFENVDEFEFPPEFLTFLKTALARESAQRYQDAASFLDAMDAAFDVLSARPGRAGKAGVELTALIDSGDLISAEVFEAPTRQADVSPAMVSSPDTPAVGATRKNEPATAWGVTVLFALVGLGLAGWWYFGHRPETVETTPFEPPDASVVAQAPVDAGASADAAPEAAPMVADLGSDTDAQGDTGSDAAVVEPVDPFRLSLGKYHTCLLQHGKARCWGANFDGELGLPTKGAIGDKKGAFAGDWIDPGFDVASLSAAGDRNASFTCLLSVAGDVKCFGANGSGQLGGSGVDAKRTVKDTPVIDIGGVATEVAAAGSQYASHVCVRLDSGDVRCWGSNRYGQLGLGHTTTVGDDEAPATVPPVKLAGPAKHVFVGKYHSCAILDDDRVTCWGWNDKGQLGLGHRNNIGDDELPQTVGVVPDITATKLALGRLHSCALLQDGAVRCWGWNGKGQLGLGHTNDLGDNETITSVEPIQLSDKAISIAAGDNHTCALLQNGHVQCWGENNFGQLGYSHTRDIGDDELPAIAGDVYLGADALDVFAGSYHNCSTHADDKVRCWGLNKFGQLGYGNTNDIGDDETPAGAGDVPFHTDPK